MITESKFYSCKPFSAAVPPVVSPGGKAGLQSVNSISFHLQSKLPPSPDSSTERSGGLDPMLYCTEWFMSIFSR